MLFSILDKYFHCMCNNFSFLIILWMFKFIECHLFVSLFDQCKDLVFEFSVKTCWMIYYDLMWRTSHGEGEHLLMLGVFLCGTTKTQLSFAAVNTCTVNQLQYACKKFSREPRHAKISRRKSVFKCLWYVIFQVIYIVIVKISHSEPVYLWKFVN